MSDQNSSTGHRALRIGYDSQGFQQRFGGVSRYFCEMIRRLPSDIVWTLPFSVTHNEYLTKEPYSKKLAGLYFEEFLPRMPMALRSLAYRASAAMEGILPGIFPVVEEDNVRQIREMAESGCVDLLHFTGPHWLGPGWRQIVGRIPYVMTVHDLIPEIFGGQEGAVRERGEALANAAHIITVSGYTKNDLVRLYGIASEKISVVYHGWNEDDLIQGRVVPGLEPQRYVLFVGSRMGYKNWRFFVRAISDILIQHDMIFVCTGDELTGEEKSFLAGLGIADRVRCMFCADEELVWLYANAHAFVYPSRYEGFGLPILEAFAKGCPVVLSRCSCFPEIAGDAALYFDEGDGERLRDCIESLFNVQLRAEQIARGIERCRRFTWERCARETADVYRRVAGEWNRI